MLRVFELGLDVLEQLLYSEEAEKSVAGYVRDFRVALSGLAADVFNGDKSTAQFASGLRSLLRSEARPTYQEGMREGGSKDPEADMEESDEQIVTSWVDEQFSFVDNFAQAVRDAKDAPIPEGSPAGVSLAEVRKSAQQAIFDRVETWGQSLDALGALGRASVQTKVMGTWHLGKTEVHCDTCSWLDGQRHQLKWFISKGYIPREPGSETLSCKGFHCDCSVTSDDGERLL